MTVTLRRARREDVIVILRMLVDDPLGKTREDVTEPIDAAYGAAFEAIDKDANSELLMAESGGRVIGCLQLTMIPGLTRHGALRAQIEGVRIASEVRGQGLGGEMIRAALARAKAKGARFAQLTSDVRRTEARRFYEKIGFSASHVGFKIEV